MNYPPDPLTALWQELSPLQRLLQQFDVVLAMLAAYALLLFVGSGLVLVSTLVSALVQRAEQGRELPRERGTRIAAPELSLSRRKYRLHVRPVRVARPMRGGKGMRWRPEFSPYFHRPR